MRKYSKAIAFVTRFSTVQLSPDELAHYGVLGMQWGVSKDENADPRSSAERQKRNTRTKLAVGTLGASVVVPKAAKAIQRRTQATKAKQSDDHVTSRRLVKTKKSELSNADLDRIINRLQKEQRVSQLNPSNTERGKKIALGVIAAAGSAATLYNLIKSPAGKSGIAQGKKVVDLILSARN